MSLFRFRVRSVERDRRTDAARFGTLREQIGRLRREIERERDGLQARYEVSLGDAAFAQQAFENGLNDAWLSARIEHLTQALMDYERRMRALDAQIAFAEEMVASLERAPVDHESDRTAPAGRSAMPQPYASERTSLPS